MTDKVKRACTIERDLSSASLFEVALGLVGVPMQKHYASASATYDNERETSTDFNMKRGCASYCCSTTVYKG